jgi:hypothetical protein
MVCKENTDDLYWFGPKNALHLMEEESPILPCTDVLIVGVTSGRERGRGSQVSRCEWSACSCDPFGSLARSRRVACSCLCEGFTTRFFCVSLEWSLHAPFIASRRCRVTRCWCVGDPYRGSSLGASGCLIWWRRGLYYRGMALVLLVLLLHGEACVPLLEGVDSVFWYCSDAPCHT